MAQKYRVSGTLHHGALEPNAKTGELESVIRTYRDGDEFSTDDAKLEKELRTSKTILLAEEYAAEAASEGNKAPTEQLAAERVAKDDEIAQLRAELAALKAVQGQGEPPKSDSSDSSDSSE